MPCTIPTCRGSRLPALCVDDRCAADAVEFSVVFDDGVAKFFGVSRADAVAVRVVLLAVNAKRFPTSEAWFAVVSADKTNALRA